MICCGTMQDYEASHAFAQALITHAQSSRIGTVSPQLRGHVSMPGHAVTLVHVTSSRDKSIGVRSRTALHCTHNT